MNNTIDPKQLPQSLVDLMEAIHDPRIPDDARIRLAFVMDKVMDDTTRRRKILSLVQDALGQLRVDMKYLMFDLDATRRERDEALEKLK